MKKAYVKILSLILSLLMVLLYTATLTGCKASEGSVDIEIPLVGKTEITMSVGDERIIPANFDDLEYESSDESILTVDANGKMTAVGSGIVTVVDSGNGRSVNVVVTVSRSTITPRFSLSSREILLGVGDSYTLSPSLSFNGEELPAEFSYESSDSETVSVNDDGKLTANKIGFAEISVFWSAFGYDNVENVTVTVSRNFIMDMNKNNVVLVEERLSESSTNKVTDTVSVSSVYVDGVSKDVSGITWTSDNENVATVSGGEITAVGKGATVIHAIYDDGDATITGNVYVTVIQEYLYTINYYLRSLSGAYLNRDPIIGSDLEGTKIKAQVKQFDGYELTKYDSTITIAADGVNALNFYYEMIDADIQFGYVENLEKIGSNGAIYGTWSQKDMTGEYARDARNNTYFFKKTVANDYSGLRYNYSANNVGGYLLVNVYFTDIYDGDGLQLWTANNDTNTDSYLVGVYDENYHAVARTRDSLIGKWVTYIFRLNESGFPSNGGTGGQGAGAYKFVISFCHNTKNSFYMCDYAFISQETFNGIDFN